VPDLDPSAHQEIARQLESGESLIWADRPRQGLVLRGGDAFLIPFSLVWFSFAVFWEFTVLSSGAPVFMSLWGVPFVLIGLYFVTGRFLVDARVRANTYYGLTSRRAIILSGLLRRTVTSISLRTLNEISVTERADRSGSIVLGRAHPFASWYAGANWPGTSQYLAPTFELIPDAKQVHDRLLAAQRAAA